MDIYTAHYRYSGPGRIDVTVKGGVYPGNVFAPTWRMVKDLQAQKITEWEYTLQYMGLMAERWYHTPENTNTAIKSLPYPDGDSITLVCFCKPQTFCHRVLVARMLQGIGFGKYLGERTL